MNNLKYPPNIDWEITSNCNHRCIHCYNYWRNESSFCEYNNSREYYMKIAERIVEEKPVSVQITGGEPLLVWNEFVDAIGILLKAGICVSINTNAVLVTDEIARYLSQNKISTFVSFICCHKSIFDDIVGVEGAFERAYNGINKLVSNNVNVSLNMVVTKKNLPYVYETAQFVKKEFNAQYFSATKASFPNNADVTFGEQLLDNREFNFMLEQLILVKDKLNMRVDSAWVYSLCGFLNDTIRNAFGYSRRCECGKYNFVIDSNGQMKACGCNNIGYGNILEDTFENAIKKMGEWRDCSLLPQICRTCSYLKYCGGGCRSDALSINGSFCNLDSTAMCENLSQINICNDKIIKNSICTNTYYSLNKDVVFVEENNFVRIGHKTNFDYITRQFYDFLISNKLFSVEHIHKQSGQPTEVVLECIMRLLDKNFIYDTMKKVSDCTDTVSDEFELFVVPYTDQHSSKMICEYVGRQYSYRRHN